MNQEAANVMERLAKDVQKYLELRMEEQKVSSSKKAAKATAVTASFMLIAFVLIFTFIFVNIAFAVVLSDYLNSLTLGFGIFGGFHLFIAVLVIVFRKKLVQKPLFKAIVGGLIGEDGLSKKKLELKQDKLELEIEKQEYRLLKQYTRLRGSYSPVAFATNLAAFIVNKNKGSDVSSLPEVLKRELLKEESTKLQTMRDALVNLFVILESYTSTATNLAKEKLIEDDDQFVIGKDDR